MNKLLFSLFLISSAFALDSVIILTGPPGGGKGTFSQYLKKNYQYHHISAGDLVRKEISKKTPIGISIEETVRRGEYIHPQLMHELLKKAILDIAEQDGCLIIDGFLTSKEGKLFLEELLTTLNLHTNTIRVTIEAKDEDCIERIAKRTVCPECEQIYNTQTECSTCKIPVTVRINDTREVAKKRIENYRNKIVHVLQETLAQYPHIVFYNTASLQEILQTYAQFAHAKPSMETSRLPHQSPNNLP